MIDTSYWQAFQTQFLGSSISVKHSQGNRNLYGEINDKQNLQEEPWEDLRKHPSQLVIIFYRLGASFSNDTKKERECTRDSSTQKYSPKVSGLFGFHLGPREFIEKSKCAWNCVYCWYPLQTCYFYCETSAKLRIYFIAYFSVVTHMRHGRCHFIVILVFSQGSVYW